MEFRQLGNTGIQLSALSFGASSLGQEFREVDLSEAIRSVRVALDAGMNFIDTSPYYGRGTSECLLGFALRDVPRDSYYLGTKLGRYDENHFDFSAKRVQESIDVSLKRMGVDYLDIILCHDIEFVEMSQIVNETLPAMREIQRQGKVRFVGVSGYPMKVFRYIVERTDLDVILSYNHYTLQNNMLAELIPYLQERGVGIMNAAPFSARLLTKAPLPPWHKATPQVREICRRAVEFCDGHGVDIAHAALQFSIEKPEFTTCITGSANPNRIQQWVDWLENPIAPEIIRGVQDLLAPIHNWFYIEGRPENNDEP